MLPAHPVPTDHAFEISISTARLGLRPLMTEDAHAMCAIAGEAEIAGMAGYVPFPLTPTSATDWIAGIDNDRPDREAFAIVMASEDNPSRSHARDEQAPHPPMIGLCGYVRDEPTSVSIGYLIGRAYWNAGYATEAASALLRHCDQLAETHIFTASHFPGNGASARVLTKLGFVMVGAGHGWCPVRRHHLPTLRYELKAAALAARVEADPR